MRDRQTQNAAILRVLESAGGDWVSMPKIVGACGPGTFIASHTRRISDLREELERRGLTIECGDDWIDGQRQTRYRIVQIPENKFEQTRLF